MRRDPGKYLYDIDRAAGTDRSVFTAGKNFTLYSEYPMLRALQQPRVEEALRLEKLRVAIQQGAAALDRGDYTEVDDTELEVFLNSLGTADETPHSP